MNSQIERPKEFARVTQLLDQFPVVALVGPRQVGKTTLALQVAELETQWHHFDLEDPRDLARLAEPSLALRPLEGLVIIDEIQRKPDLFPLLRVLADRKSKKTRFLVLGSASPALIQDGSESLAGRIAFHQLRGFSLAEVGESQLNNLWLRGGFPRSTLAADDDLSAEWREQFIQAFVQRDLPQLGFNQSSSAISRFWAMLAHCHGQTLNYSEIGRSLALSDNTVRTYVAILESTFMVRLLQPWFENISKRQVKSPKLYMTDSGIFHALMGIDTWVGLQRHPKLGASWEGFALMEVLRAYPRHQAYFWATHAGAELDLLLVRGEERLGFEFKRSDSPSTSKSMHVAIEDLKLKQLTVIHAGESTFPLAENIIAQSLSDFSIGM
jgi:predicted AAA+ superfamily ATPase